MKNKNQSLPNGTILKWLRKPSAGYKKDIGRLLSPSTKMNAVGKKSCKGVFFSQQVKITHNQGCVRLTVFRDRNTWNMSLKSFVFLEIHIKIIKHLLKRYGILNIFYYPCCFETRQTYRFHYHSTYSYSGIGSIERAPSH